ncbi:hypothetical protein BTO32_15540 [Marinobacter lutaoensis]|uniref:Uncharacterized protein n=1 Tax=Marinobacter lutaoensis TaxID=135739 RepID=A0A1V2DQG7_9GAMM|nr:hypothetical protein [Marinobacter lutaoensis]ONF42616.1 hypothetical protein BTO32_15540 [Marinobacter lutaoensis]
MTPEQQQAGYQTIEAQIPAFQCKRVSEKAKELSAKAQKIGMPPFTLQFGKRVNKRVAIGGDHGESLWLEVVSVKLIAGQPKLNGWRVVARIEHDEAGNLVHLYGQGNYQVASTKDLLSELSICAPKCEHCNYNRQRKTTFLLENREAQKVQQVGSSCLQDFTGHENPETVLAMNDAINSFIEGVINPDDAFYADAKNYDLVPMEFILRLTSAIVRVTGGWIPKDNRQGIPNPNATIFSVYDALKRPTLGDRVRISDEDFENAELIMAWLTHEKFDHRGEEYRANLSQLAKRGYIPRKYIGLAASAVAAFQRELSQATCKAKAKIRSPKAPMFIGQKDERIERSVTLIRKVPIDGQFGFSVLHIFEDNETGSKLTWFNSGSEKFKEGLTYTIAGRVKEHRTRDGEKETVLTRVSCPDLKLHKTMHPNMDVAAFVKKLKKIEDVNARDHHNETLLHEASALHERYGDFGDIIRELLRRGADPSFRSTCDNCCAFDYWVTLGDDELITTGLEKWPELTADWGDSDLSSLGFQDREWVPAFRSARNKAIAQIKQREQEERRNALARVLGENHDETECEADVLGAELDDDDLTQADSDSEVLRIA